MEKLLNNFATIIGYEKPHGTFYKGTLFSGTYCGSNRINSLGPKKSIETNFSKNKCSHGDKSVWPIFVVLSSVKNLKKQFPGVHKLF